jgi:mono/diheme cytochrome c family protein
MWRRRAETTFAAIVLLALGAGGTGYWQTQHRANQKAVQLTGGNPKVGRMLMRQFGCAGCHTVSGVPGGVGRVGPQLDTVSRQVYIAGVLTNTPDNLVQWIVDPKAANPRSAMPRTGITEAQARDVAAYLYSLD